MIEVFNNQISRDMYQPNYEILDIFFFFFYMYWHGECARLGINIDTAKDGGLEYMVIIPTQTYVNLGYIKCHFSIIVQDNVVHVHNFTGHKSFALRVNNDYVLDKVSNYLNGELTDDKINALHDDLNAFLDNVADYAKTLDLSMCWPTIKCKSARN